MAQAHASIGLSPTKIEINANKVKSNYVTTALEIKGDVSQPMRFKVYTGFFTINEKGEMNLIDRSDDKYNIAKKIKYVPSEFNVFPGKSQKLRINIPNINQLPDGENRAVIYIEDVNPKEQLFDSGRDGIGAQLIVKTRIGVPIYINKGKFTKEGQIEYFNMEQTKSGLFSKVKINSVGNSMIRYTAKIQIIDDKKLVDEYKLNGGVVGDNNYFISRDKVKTDKLEPNKDYIARVVITYTDHNGKKQNIKEETILNVKGEL